MNWRHGLNAVLLGASSLSGLAEADTLSLKLSVQQWQTDATGFFGEARDATITPNFSEQSQHKFQFSVEHPFPLVPNVFVAYSQNEFGGGAQLEQTYRLGGQVYSVASVLNSSLEYGKTDLALYYELLDNSLFEFDLGMQVRYLSASYRVTESLNDLSSSVSANDWQPMAYVKLQSGLPLVGIRSYIQLAKGDDNYEYEAAVGYQFADSIIADLSVFLGYKDSKLKLDSVDGIYAQNEWQAVFVGLELAF